MNVGTKQPSLFGLRS